MPRRKIRLSSRFSRHVEQTPDCWNWTGARTGSGYGALSVDGRAVPAHRVAWLLAHGHVGPDDRIFHRCGNRVCVRPDHLELLRVQGSISVLASRLEPDAAVTDTPGSPGSPGSINEPGFALARTG